MDCYLINNEWSYAPLSEARACSPPRFLALRQGARIFCFVVSMNSSTSYNHFLINIALKNFAISPDDSVCNEKRKMHVFSWLLLFDGNLKCGADCEKLFLFWLGFRSVSMNWINVHKTCKISPLLKSIEETSYFLLDEINVPPQSKTIKIVENKKSRSKISQLETYFWKYSLPSMGKKKARTLKNRERKVRAAPS